MDGKLCPLFNEKREVLPSLPSRSYLNLFPFLTLLLYHLFFSPVLQLFIPQSILVSLQHCISSELSIFRKWFGLRHLDKPFGKGYCSILPADTLLVCFPFPSPQCLLPALVYPFGLSFCPLRQTKDFRAAFRHSLLLTFPLQELTRIPLLVDSSLVSAK